MLDVALIDTLGEWMTYAALYTEYGGTPPPRTGASHATIAPYGPLSHPRRRHRRCRAEQPRMGGVLRARPAAARARLGHAIRNQRAARAAPRGVDRRRSTRCCSQLPSAEVLRRLEAANLATANVNSVREYLQHPQLTDVTAGARSSRLPARCARSCRRCAWKVWSRSWARCRRLASTPRPSWRSWRSTADAIARWAESGVILSWLISLKTNGSS